MKKKKIIKKEEKPHGHNNLSSLWAGLEAIGPRSQQHDFWPNILPSNEIYHINIFFFKNTKGQVAIFHMSKKSRM